MVRQGATTKPGVRHGLSRTSGAEVSKLGPDVGLIQARERRRDSGAEGAENRHRNEAETGCRHRGMETKARIRHRGKRDPVQTHARLRHRNEGETRRRHVGQYQAQERRRQSSIETWAKVRRRGRVRAPAWDLARRALSWARELAPLYTGCMRVGQTCIDRGAKARAPVDGMCRT